MAVMTRMKASRMPTSDLQWQARKLAMRASRLADQAGPTMNMATRSAGRKGGQAAMWARPRVGRMRAWMAMRAELGSVKVQDTWAPRMSAALKATSRRLDPPKTRSRRWPKVAGAVLFVAGLAAAAAAARSRLRQSEMFVPPQPVPHTPSSVKVQDQTLAADKQRAEPDASGLTRNR